MTSCNLQLEHKECMTLTDLVKHVHFILVIQMHVSSGKTRCDAEEWGFLYAWTIPQELLWSPFQSLLGHSWWNDAPMSQTIICARSKLIRAKMKPYTEWMMLRRSFYSVAQICLSETGQKHVLTNTKDSRSFTTNVQSNGIKN